SLLPVDTPVTEFLERDSRAADRTDHEPAGLDHAKAVGAIKQGGGGLAGRHQHVLALPSGRGQSNLGWSPLGRAVLLRGGRGDAAGTTSSVPSRNFSVRPASLRAAAASVTAAPTASRTMAYPFSSGLSG